MFDVLEAYLNLILPSPFWVLWELARNYLFLSAVIIFFVGLLVSFITLSISLYKKYKNLLSFQKKNIIANRLSGQNWISLERKTHHVTAPPDFLSFLGITNLDLTFESLLLALDSSDRLAFREFALSPQPTPACLLVSVGFKAKRFFCVTRDVESSDTGMQLILGWRDITEIVEARIHENQQRKYQVDQNICLNQILDSLPWPLWVMDKNRDQISYCNLSYAKALETSKKEVINKSLTLGAPSQEGYGHGVQKQYTINGVRKCLEFQEILMDRNEKFLHFAFDRTEEKALSRKLERYLSLYREVLETLSAGVVIYDPDKRVSFHNHSYTQMFGMDDKWLNSGPMLGEVLDDLNRRRLLSEQADYPTYKKREINMISGLLSPFQELMYLPDQRTIRKITAPHPAGGIFYIFEDVTTSLDLERRFNTQIQVQKSTLDNLYEGIAVFGSDNRLRFTNPAFKKLWDWNPTTPETTGHLSELLEHIRNLISYDSDWDAFKEKLIHRLTDRVPKRRQIPLKDKRFFEFSYTPLPDGSHLFGFHDVTSFMSEAAKNSSNRKSA